MYIIKKNINGKDYWYLRKSVREGDKVISKNIAYLGKSKDEAERRAREFTEGKKEQKPEIKEPKEKKELTIEDIAVFCKRKGFVFKSSEIYGGFSGFWDFGSLGTELFNNIKNNFWKFFVNRENMIGIDCSIISHPQTWKASGHITSFKDIAVVCEKCKKATKIDVSEEGKVKCDCGGEYEKQGEFNLLFKTNVGALNPLEAYLRGETAQGMFLNFKNIVETGRNKLPFGIAQIGKCFRNEIAPRDFLFRSREFTIGEFEFFIHPDEKKCSLLEKKHLNFELMLLDAETQEQPLQKVTKDSEQKPTKDEIKKTTIGKMLKDKKLGEWHAYWLAEQLMWFVSLGLKIDNFKIREHTKDELSHYSSATFDIDYLYPFGSLEVAGNANRGQYDLSQHIKESKKNLEMFDEDTKKRIIPRVIEPTFGMERVFLAVIVDAYEYDDERENIVLKLDSKLAPVKAAVFPIVNKPGFLKLGRKIYEDLSEDWNIQYDTGGSVGRRYSRQDEIGTPYCITIDGDSIKNKDCTIRNRNTTQQIRVKVKDLKEIIRKLLNSEIKFEKAGKIISTRKK